MICLTACVLCGWQILSYYLTNSTIGDNNQKIEITQATEHSTTCFEDIFLYTIRNTLSPKHPNNSFLDVKTPFSDHKDRTI